LWVLIRPLYGISPLSTKREGHTAHIITMIVNKSYKFCKYFLA